MYICSMKILFLSTHAVHSKLTFWLLQFAYTTTFSFIFLLSYAGVAALMVLAGAAVSLSSKHTTIIK